jgi:competence protein ComEC
MFFFTLALMYMHRPDSISNYEIESLNKKQVFSGRIISDPKLKDYGYRYEVELEGRYFDSNIYNTDRKLMLYHSSKLEFRSPKYGQHILFYAKLDTIKGAQYPHEFDYKKYLYRKNIHYRSYPVNIVLSDPKSRNWFIRIRQLSFQVRDRLLVKLQNSGLNKDELAICSAVLLGYDDFLNIELKESFQHAGAMHMLCVSGLHVGIIFLILKLLFRFLSRKQWHKILQSCLILLIIWMYTFITGMAPSTLRASLMISILIFGTLFRGQYNSINSLLVSAFIMILGDPFLVFNIGFQLSYLAVASILIFYPRLSGKIIFRSLVFRKLWQASVVSIAANIGTFPVVLFNFASFPNYFLVTNILVSLFAAPILFIGFSFFLVGTLPVIGEIIALGLKYSVQLLIGGIRVIESFPFSTWSLQIDIVSTILLYILVFNGFLYIRSKQIYFLRYALFTVLCLSVRANIKAYNYNNGVSHFEYKKTKIVAIARERVATIYFSGEMNDYNKIKTYILDPYLSYYKIGKYEVRFVESDIFPDKVQLKT